MEPVVLPAWLVLILLVLLAAGLLAVGAWIAWHLTRRKLPPAPPAVEPHPDPPSELDSLPMHRPTIPFERPDQD